MFDNAASRGWHPAGDLARRAPIFLEMTVCGIIGYIGHRVAVPILVTGLKRLEYRGYDSAGIAVLEGGELRCVKAVGRIAALETKLNGAAPSGTIGIAHTRWATHGAPTEVNAPAAAAWPWSTTGSSRTTRA